MNSTCAHFADEVRSHVRGAAELAAHLQVADTADGIPELGQAVGARHQQSHVGSDITKLRGGDGRAMSAVWRITFKTKNVRKRLSDLRGFWQAAHLVNDRWVVDVDG